MRCADLAISLNQSHDGFLGARLAEGAVLGLTTDEGFIGFDDLVLAAHRASLAIAHTLADAVGHEPCGLVSHAEHTM